MKFDCIFVINNTNINVLSHIEIKLKIIRQAKELIVPDIDSYYFISSIYIIPLRQKIFLILP